MDRNAVDNKIFLVKNRSSSVVVYSIPEENIRREFSPSETKKIKFYELEKLIYQPGGRAILTNFLQIEDDNALNELSVKAEPEYFMSEKQIVQLLAEGSQDSFLDALDFAPIGVIDLIKQYSIELPLTDSRKIEALKQKTGFDVNAALANKAKEKEDEPEETKPATRRVKEATASTGRRTETSYKKVVKTASTTEEIKK